MPTVLTVLTVEHRRLWQAIIIENSVRHNYPAGYFSPTISFCWRDTPCILERQIFSLNHPKEIGIYITGGFFWFYFLVFDVRG